MRYGKVRAEEEPFPVAVREQGGDGRRGSEGDVCLEPGIFFEHPPCMGFGTAVGKDGLRVGMAGEEAFEAFGKLAGIFPRMDEDAFAMFRRIAEDRFQCPAVYAVCKIPVLGAGMQLYAAVVKGSHCGFKRNPFLRVFRQIPQVGAERQPRIAQALRIGGFLLATGKGGIITAGGCGGITDELITILP